MTRLDAAEYECAITWNLVIAAELIGTDIPYHDEGKERCWGAFHVCRQTGLWHDFAAAVDRPPQGSPSRMADCRSTHWPMPQR
jgi:hypothetical protein